MKEKIFAITCVTCQARLAVRSAEAVGTIVECPRCESMVQVEPPPGWVPPTPENAPADASVGGPPPLSRVATASDPLDLEPSATSSGLGSHLTLLVGLSAALVVVAALFAVPRFLSSPAVETEIAAVDPAAADNASITIPEKNADQPPVASDVTASREQPRPPAESPKATKPESQAPTTSVVTSPSSAAPPRDASPSKKSSPAASAKQEQPKSDPFGRVAPEDDQSQLTEIRKTPPAQIDVAVRLSQPVAGMDLHDVPLEKLVELLSMMGGLPVTIDADALAQLGVTPRDSISLQLSATTVGAALEAAAAAKGLGSEIQNNQTVITSPSDYREKLRNVRYNVADLAGNEAAGVEVLAALVRRLVAPSSWQEAGGRGTLAIQPGALVIVQSSDVHQQVLVFCEKLRGARHLPYRSRGNPQQFLLATRQNQARKTLDQEVTLNFREPAPLAEILAFLAETTGSTLLVDHAALAAADTSDAIEATATAKNEPCGAMLAKLLRPLGLRYRAIGSGVIQVTTKEAADERMELEFYPVANWIAQGTSGPNLAERLKARVASASWSDVGGPGEIYFDTPSQCLIVLQSQPAQAAIERLLATGKP